MVTVEELKASLNKVDLVKLKVRAAAEFKLDSLTTSHLDTLCVMARHCALNGPVGVKVKTTWPGYPDLGTKSIQDVHSAFTAALWKGFVNACNEQLDLNNEQVKTSYCVVKFGSVWPTCEPVFKPKAKAENK